MYTYMYKLSMNVIIYYIYILCICIYVCDIWQRFRLELHSDAVDSEHQVKRQRFSILQFQNNYITVIGVSRFVAKSWVVEFTHPKNSSFET